MTNFVLATELNVTELMQSTLFDEFYEKGLDINNDALTQIYGNDAESIFKFASLQFDISEVQLEVLSKLENIFVNIEKAIDPERLKFTITKAMDNEICINRKTLNGSFLKIIIHEDGLIAFSYMTEKSSNDILHFYESDKIDFETVSYQFFIH